MKYYLEKMCEERPTYVRLDVPRARALCVCTRRVHPALSTACFVSVCRRVPPCPRV